MSNQFSLLAPRRSALGASCMAAVYLLLALALTACTGMRIVDSQVDTRVQWPGQAMPTTNVLYRFERLPSDVNSIQAGWAELQVQAALTPLGWARDDAAAQYSVWIGVRSAEYIADPWGRPVRGPWLSGARANLLWSHRASGFGLGAGLGFMPPVGYMHEVSLVIRELQSSRVVYQTRASHEGPWTDAPHILSAVIAAALQGFPNPSPAQRRVDISIPR